MNKRTSSRIAVIAGWIVLAGAGMVGGVGSAFATSACVGSSDDPGGVCDITATVAQVVPPTPDVALSNSTQTNYVRYRVTLKHYADRLEGFSQVKFVADTVVTAAGAGAANFIETTTATVANNVGGAFTNGATACVITTTHLECTFNFDSSGFDGNAPQATITFDVTVQSPTASAAGSLNLITSTSYTEAGGGLEPESFSLTSTTNLTVPDPAVVDTYVPVAGGTVTTGANQGAATCVGGPAGSDPNKFVTIVKVPEPAQVGINLNRVGGIDDDVPLNTIFFSRIQIPNLVTLGVPQLFGVGTRWYDPDAKTKLVVNTLRRDKCTIGSGTGSLKDALLILKEKIYYKPDIPYPAAPELTPVYKPLLLCFVTSGPYPGQPCIVYAQVYTKFNLPNVANKLDYLGDHEWLIFSNENGRIALPTN